MDRFKSLPDGITLDIISRLPTEDVLECKLVSTAWRSIIRHSSFSKMHLDRLNHPESDSGKTGFIAFTSIDGKNYDNLNLQYFEYDENHESIDRIKRLNFNPPFGGETGCFGWCNGLICLAPDEFLTEKGLYICNPITREYMSIMLPEISRGGVDHGGIGFGYVSSTNEYKIVTIMSKEVHVYTLGSGFGWRNLGNFNFGSTSRWHEGKFLNGVLYWFDSGLHMIIPFDLAEEKFCEHISLPFKQENNIEETYVLGVMNGCLSFALWGFYDDDDIADDEDCLEYWDVWLLEKKNIEERQSMSWGIDFRIYDHLFAITKNHGFLTSYHNHINLSDSKVSKTIVDFTEHFGHVFPHKNTLVSLKELREEATKIMEPVEFEDAERFNQLQEDETLDTYL